MTFKVIKKRFQRALARYGLFGTRVLYKFLPFSLIRFSSKILVAIGYVFVIGQRRIAKESLLMAFGNEKSDAEISQIVRQCINGVGYNIIDMVYFMAHPERAKEFISVSGREHLDQAFKKGNGVVAVTAHFGNFPLMMLYLAQEGYPSHAIVRQSRDEKMEKYLSEKRDGMGLKTIYARPRRDCIEGSLKALKKNEMVFMPIDQNFGALTGVFVDFFGRKAATATGPVVIAQKTGAVILPMFIISEGRARHRLIIEPPFELIKKDHKKEMLTENMAVLTQKIEKYIRKYPQEWGWMHRRWKSQPNIDKV